jgi:tetratricopeptide (TPR) repeat protein
MRTDFDIELEKIDQALAEIRPRAFALPIDAERATKCVYLLYQRASLMGDLKAFADVEANLKKATSEIGAAQDLYLLKANLDFKLHRLTDVKNDLQTGRELQETTQGRALRADLDFQEGRYDAARKAYEAVIRDDLTWDNLARLAYLKWKLGDPDGADQLYEEAEDELTAKEMRHYAWIELQRGVLDLRRGRHEDAQAHYNRAEHAYTGYWLVDDHKAELFGAQKRYQDAAELYEKVIARAPKPELQQALGELYEVIGQTDRAEACYESALQAYLNSANRGEVHFYHHLTDFYSDVRQDGAEAVKWARKDIVLRRNFSTLSALAWALYRAGEFLEARETITEALASGASDAHLFYQAAMIHQASSKNGQGEQYLNLAASINPHYRSFHVHR